MTAVQIIGPMLPWSKNLTQEVRKFEKLMIEITEYSQQFGNDEATEIAARLLALILPQLRDAIASVDELETTLSPLIAEQHRGLIF